MEEEREREKGERERSFDAKLLLLQSTLSNGAGGQLECGLIVRNVKKRGRANEFNSSAR